ncbi:MAG: hypothetical protein LBM71_01850 [Elusimicrobiota bacterium]|nr:hypothetical protein [Elusimicrobiota bacterium]
MKIPFRYILTNCKEKRPMACNVIFSIRNSKIYATIARTETTNNSIN